MKYLKIFFDYPQIKDIEKILVNHFGCIFFSVYKATAAEEEPASEHATIMFCG